MNDQYKKLYSDTHDILDILTSFNEKYKDLCVLESINIISLQIHQQLTVKKNNQKKRYEILQVVRDFLYMLNYRELLETTSSDYLTKMMLEIDEEIDNNKLI